MMRKIIGLFILMFLVSCKNEVNKELENLFLLKWRLDRVTLSGKAVKGEIKNANVTVHPLNAEGTCESLILGQGTTDDSGNYNLSYSRIGGNVCVSISARTSGATRIYDEKLGRDIPVEENQNFSLSHIVRESTLTDNRKVGIFVSPFTRMIQSRVQALAKESPGADISNLTRRASKEIVIRFGLSRGLGARSVNAKINDADYPELDELTQELNNPNSSVNTKHQLFLAGLSQMAHQNKKGQNLAPTDLDNVMGAFANDMSNGKFDGQDSSGQPVLIGSTGKPLGANALTNQLLPAIKTFVQEGGKVGTNPNQPITVNLTDLNTITFIETAEVISSTSGGTPPTLTYTGGPYTFTGNAPITTLTPTFTGTITSCSATPALPAGLTINNTTCAISGTPTVTHTATNHTITASNSSGSTSAIINITVNMDPPASLTYTGGPYIFTQNSSITTITPTFTGTITSCSVSPALPAGLTLSNTNCSISGTPTVTQVATNHTITANNSFGITNTTINITIDIAPPSSLTYTGGPFVFTKNTGIATLIPTFTGTITSCSASPALPAGLTINNTTCAISGTPTASQLTTNHIITATNVSGNTNTTINITVKLIPPAFSPSAGTYSAFQNVAISTTEGSSQIRYTTDGTLPDCTTSPIYSTAIRITSNKNLKAITCKSGETSEISAAGYTLNLYVLDFAGVDDRVTTTTMIPYSAEFTVTAWIKANNNGTVFAWGSAVVNNYTTVERYFDKFRSSVGSGSGLTYLDSVVFPSATWTHLAMVKKTDHTVELYINGSLVLTQVVPASNITTSPTDTSLGGGFFNNSYQGFFSGQIAELTVWNVPKTVAEIQSLKDTSPLGNEAGLIAYYDFQHSSGTTLANKATTGTTYNGTLHNFALTGTTSNWILVSDR